MTLQVSPAYLQTFAKIGISTKNLRKAAQDGLDYLAREWPEECEPMTFAAFTASVHEETGESEADCVAAVDEMLHNFIHRNT